MSLVNQTPVRIFLRPHGYKPSDKKKMKGKKTYQKFLVDIKVKALLSLSILLFVVQAVMRKLL